jgi:predicted transcriptional regulator
MARATPRNFHVPLPEDLYDRLRKEAERSMEPATEIARHAIEDYLEKRRRDALYSAIRDYAKRHAGTMVDLDDELEAASSEYVAAGEEESK